MGAVIDRQLCRSGLGGDVELNESVFMRLRVPGGGRKGCGELPLYE